MFCIISTLKFYLFNFEKLLKFTTISLKLYFSGTSQADVALLVVASQQGEFESGFNKKGKGSHTGGQTREHLSIVRSLGISQLVVAVNKLDCVGYDQSRWVVDWIKTECFLFESQQILVNVLCIDLWLLLSHDSFLTVLHRKTWLSF